MPKDPKHISNCKIMSGTGLHSPNKSGQFTVTHSPNMGRIEQYKQDDLKRISHNTPMASDCGTLAALTDTN